MGVRLLKIRKVSKEEVYRYIAEMYGYTFDQIAEMNDYQKYVLLQTPKEITFATIDDYKQWLKANAKHR